MTGGIFMAIVGVYIMSFGNLRDFDILVFIGAVMATIGFVISWHYEDDYRYYIGKLQKEMDFYRKKDSNA